MMIPFQVSMIGAFQVIHWLRWTDSYYALIVPGLASPFGVFLLRQFFLTLPTELEDAARIDGASRLRVIRHVIVPLSRPALATLGIFTFMGVWNEFLWPLVVLNSQEHYTVQLGLAVFRDQRSTVWNLLMAGTVTATLPILIVFFFGRPYFIRGIALTGLEGWETIRPTASSLHLAAGREVESRPARKSIRKTSPVPTASIYLGHRLPGGLSRFA